MDDERLKNPPVDGSGIPDYFDELLERIRDIRASERRMYLRVREIFALAADYDATRQDDGRVLPDHPEQAALRGDGQDRSGADRRTRRPQRARTWG